MLSIKRPIFELQFDKLFRFVTTSVEYKVKVFYSRVKLILEANKILVFAYNNKNVIDKYEMYNPLLVLDFDQVTAAISIKSKNKIKISVLGYNKNFKFRTNSKEIFEQILIHLNHYIETSKGREENLLGISLRTDFYKVLNLINISFITYTKEIFKKKPEQETY